MRPHRSLEPRLRAFHMPYYLYYLMARRLDCPYVTFLWRFRTRTTSHVRNGNAILSEQARAFVARLSLCNSLILSFSL